MGRILVAAVFFVGGLLSACGRPAGMNALPNVAGYAKDGEQHLFTSADLYKVIDGEADLFLPYGFTRALFQDYTTADGARVGAEIYWMGSPLDAFGIYSVTKSESFKPFALDKTNAAIGSTQLLFQKGVCFGRLTAMKADGAEKALSGLAAAIAAPLADAPVPELTRINVPAVRDVKFVARDALDIPHFDRCLVAKAAVGDRPVDVFAMIGDVSAAMAALKANTREFTRQGDYFRANHPKLGVMILRAAGRAVVGVAGLDKPEDGLPLLEQLAAAQPKG